MIWKPKRSFLIAFASIPVTTGNTELFPPHLHGRISNNFGLNSQGNLYVSYYLKIRKLVKMKRKVMGNHQLARDFYGQISHSLKDAHADLKDNGVSDWIQDDIRSVLRCLISQKRTAIWYGVYDYSSATEVSDAVRDIVAVCEPKDLLFALDKVQGIINVALEHSLEAHDLFDAAKSTGVLRPFRFYQLKKSAAKAVAAEHRAVDLGLQIVTAIAARIDHFLAPD